MHAFAQRLAGGQVAQFVQRAVWVFHFQPHLTGVHRHRRGSSQGHAVAQSGQFGRATSLDAADHTADQRCRIEAQSPARCRHFLTCETGSDGGWAKDWDLALLDLAVDIAQRQLAQRRPQGCEQAMGGQRRADQTFTSSLGCRQQQATHHRIQPGLSVGPQCAMPLQRQPFATGRVQSRCGLVALAC